MKAESTIRPNKFEIREVKDNLCEIVFFDDIQEEKRMHDEEEETIYKYREYTLKIAFREDLQKDIDKNIKEWLNYAKKQDYDQKASEIRKIRDELLKESDKEMTIDRLGLNLSSDITASNLLSATKDFFTSLISIINGEMAKYRQALRDLPEQDGFPYDVTFPEKPNK